jgi:hypothetical protein
VRFLSRLLGKTCAHYFSWPRTDSDGRYYQICSRCGIAYEYDWSTMHLTKRLMVANGVNSPVSAAIPKAEVAARVPLGR